MAYTNAQCEDLIAALEHLGNVVRLLSKHLGEIPDNDPQVDNLVDAIKVNSNSARAVAKLIDDKCNPAP